MSNRKPYFLVLSFFILLVSACKKDPQIILDNDAPYYKGLSTIKIENYINKLYIDLIGRQPLQTEFDRDVQALKDGGYSSAAREAIVLRLQTDTTHLAGDSSYKYSYYNKIYEMAKAKTIEATSDKDIYEWARDNYQYQITADSSSPTPDYAKIELLRREKKKLTDIISSQRLYRQDSIEINELFARMINNYFYDKINMNSFNFINAVFNDLLYRFPDPNEYNQSYTMVEYDNPSVLFTASGQNKGDFIRIVTNSHEFYEGLIWWSYKTYLSRSPSTAEIYTYIQTFYIDHDLQKLQRQILVTDEYAGF